VPYNCSEGTNRKFVVPTFYSNAGTVGEFVSCDQLQAVSGTDQAWLRESANSTYFTSWAAMSNHLPQ
jgi:hypothetical protein